MTKRIIFIGAAGCGKTTLAGEVFTEMKRLNLKVEHVPEWIRGDIQRHGPLKSIWEQYRTHQKQKDIEDAVPEETDYAIIDSGTLTPYFYACLYADRADERQRLVLCDLYEYLLKDLYLCRYDHIFFLPAEQTIQTCPDAFQDGTRFQTTNEIMLLNDHMEMLFTKVHRVNNVTVVDGPFDDRCRRVLEVILGSNYGGAS